MIRINLISIAFFLAVLPASAQSIRSRAELSSILSDKALHVFRTESASTRLHSECLKSRLQTLMAPVRGGSGRGSDGNLRQDPRNGVITFDAVQSHRRPTDFSAPLSKEQALELAQALMNQDLGLNKDDYFLESSSNHVIVRENGVQSVEDICFNFRRLIDGIRCYGPGTVASVRVGREMTINHVYIDWPSLSGSTRASKRSSKDVLTALPANEQHRLNSPATRGNEEGAPMLVYHSKVLPDGSLEFIPSLGFRGAPISNPEPGSPRYEPTFVPLAQ